MYKKKRRFLPPLITIILQYFLVLLYLALPSTLGYTQERSQNDETYQIAIVPDIQRYSGFTANRHLLTQQVQWIANNLDRENIVFMTQLGDIIHTIRAEIDKESQWEFAAKTLNLLNDTVPYSMAYGNHDLANFRSGNRDTTLAQKYFGAQRYAGAEWFGGSSPQGSSFYQYFEMGDHRLLHLAIVFSPDEETLAWAAELIREQNLPTIISTHAYLTDAGKARGNAGTVEAGRDSIGVRIWDNLVRSSDQVFMVIGGHNHAGENIQTAGEYGEDGEYHQISLNDNDRPVYELLANYQDYPNGGDGWLQLLAFDFTNGKFSVRTYSTYHDKFQTDAMSLYELDIDFSERWKLNSK